LQLTEEAYSFGEHEKAVGVLLDQIKADQLTEGTKKSEKDKQQFLTSSLTVWNRTKPSILTQPV
jgi:hypothetical protein